MKPSIKLVVLAGFLVVPMLSLWGCGDKETDPHAKVDAPGYYNGPMQPRGSNAAGSEGKTDNQ